MKENVAIITCPYCNREIPLDQVLTHQIREKLQKEFNEEIKKREKDLKGKEEALSQKTQELEAMKAAQEKALEQHKAVLNKKYSEDLAGALKEAEETARKKAEQTLSAELGDLKEQLDEKVKQVQQLKDMELQFRKEKRKLEEEKQNLELELTRRLDEERDKIREAAEKRMAEQQRLKDAEKEKLIADMRAQIEDLKRKAEQGSQQLQGEVLEIELEELLKASFRHDTVEPVPKGMRGADVIQRVCTTSGQLCGTIIWESKRTKAWSDGWIEKLKEDQREGRADIAVLVSTVLPRGVSGIFNMDGVWVADYTLAVGLAMALRAGLVQVAVAKSSAVGKNEKMEMLYEYLAGPEFRQQIEGIVEAFASMKKDLDAEKRSMEKIWAKREKQIERVVKNTGRMYGSMQGIIGSTLPELKSLELKALSEGDE
jgi:hypothetical protein